MNTQPLSKSKNMWPNLIALLGGILYLIQAKTYMLTQASVLDEGAYIYKGWLFASGQYTPFQEYGPVTNHMPLSFLIPGYVQNWFGLGLREARLFAVVISVIGLVGLWLAVYRMGGNKKVWWAAFAVWAVALNPAYIKMFSVAISQGLVFSFVAWILALTLNNSQKPNQLYFGAFLTGLLGLTRLNLFPFVFLTAGYLLWRYQKPVNQRAALITIGTFAAGHVLYFPGIINLWLHWLPNDLAVVVTNVFPALPKTVDSIGTAYWSAQPEPSAILQSSFYALRTNLIPLLAIPVAIGLWPRRNRWTDPADFKTALFLLTSFLILLGLHAYATFTGTHCPFCLEVYITFFSPLALALIVFLSPNWQDQPSPPRTILMIGVSLAALAWLVFPPLVELSNTVLNTEIANFGANLWVVIANKFGFFENSIFSTAPFITLAVGIALILILTALIKKHTSKNTTYSQTVFATLVSLSLILSPTSILSGYQRIYECGQDVVASYEVAGEALQTLVPAEATIYWQGGLSVAPLLYIPSVNIYPPQINGNYSYYVEGDTDGLLRLGYWNPELADQWLREAEYVLVAEEWYEGELQTALQTSSYKLIGATPAVVDCRENSAILVFRQN